MKSCIYNYKSPTLLNLSIYNSLQSHELQKEQNILYNTRVWPVHHELSLSARSTPLQEKDFVLLLSSGKGWKKKGWVRQLSKENTTPGE